MIDQREIYAWLGYWRDKMPAEAVSQLQDLLGPLRAAEQQTCVHPWERIGINADGGYFCVECLATLVKDPPFGDAVNQTERP